MSSCIAEPSVSPVGWVSAPSNAWYNWKPEHSNIKSLVNAIIFPKHSLTTFMEEEFLAKIYAIDKGTLFSLLPMDILNIIYIWRVRL